MNRLRGGFSRSALAGFPPLAMLLALGFGTLPGVPLGAQPTPHGSQFQVNAFTLSAQQEPAVAAHPDGGFVAVWESWGSPGPDQEQSSIQVRRFEADGTPAGPQAQVNTSTLGTEDSVRVATTPAGGFVVIWCGPGPSAADDDLGIRARRYDAAGAAIGDEFQINDDTADAQQQPVVAVDPVTGDFLVAWKEDADESIQARRFAADGTPDGPQFAVNQVTGGQQSWPSVAPLGDGEFVVAWASPVSPGDDPDWSVQVLRFDATGAPIGNQLQANTVITGTQDYPSVAGNLDGTFVVAWTSWSSGGDDADGTSVQLRRFDATGAPLGPEEQVNTFTPGYQSGARAAIDAHGHVLVVWNSNGSPGSDQDGWSIHGRRFDSGGDPIGDEFQVNSFTAGDQSSAGVANDALGDFVVIWKSTGSDGTDHDGTSIQGLVFDDVFREDFEAGTLVRWGAKLP